MHWDREDERFGPPFRPEPPEPDAGPALAVVLGVLSLVVGSPMIRFAAGLLALFVGTRARVRAATPTLRPGPFSVATMGVVAGCMGMGLVVSTYAAGLALALRDGHDVRDGRDDAPRFELAPVSKVRVEELRREKGPFDAQLGAMRKEAAENDGALLLETTRQGCDACDDVADAIGRPLMQRALANVIFVRADEDEWKQELEERHMFTRALPWFYLIDEKLKPADAIGADEWDENIAENIAPVLGKFVRGTLDARREPRALGTPM